MLPEDMRALLSKSPQTEVKEDGTVTMYLYEDVTEESVNRILADIYKYAADPLTLRIKSYGGSLLEAFALADAIQKFDINTHVDGYAMSAGLLIFASSQVRTATPRASFMFHGLAYGMYGQMPDHEVELEYSKFLESQAIDIMTKNTKFKKEELEQYIAIKKNWYFGYEESKEYNLISHEVRSIVQEVEIFEYVSIIEEDVVLGEDIVLAKDMDATEITEFIVETVNEEVKPDVSLSENATVEEGPEEASKK
jgi:ATP-dependent protease ClpP protease subunit